ncbi:nitronate monooxygenase [Massilia sp. H-1]|nr:nitronate monooxygenase [Massilia sp. H-1]
MNQIVHQSNERLEHDVEMCVKHQVPIIISSLRAPPKEMLDAIHSYGGIVLHDVVSIRHAQKALEAGVDGLILVAAGAGGHAGPLSPFALVGEVRKFFSGPVALSGSIATGDGILAAQAMGADFAYIGSRWLATQESNVTEGYLRSDCRIGGGGHRVHQPVHRRARQLPEKIDRQRLGLDPDALPESDKSKMSFGDGTCQSLARHLGRRPGRGHDGRRPDRRRNGGPPETRIRRRPRPPRPLTPQQDPHQNRGQTSILQFGVRPPF